jgi:hypothetical protein
VTLWILYQRSGSDREGDLKAMKQRGRLGVLAVGMALCGVLLACGLSALLGARPSSAFSRAQELADAQNRWLSRPVAHYRLVMQAPSWCRLDVEIRAEQVVRVFENSCPGAPQTVTGMFEMIKQIDSAAGTIFCAPAGCECTEVRYVTASYDQQLGFPRSIRLRHERQANWPELWRFFMAHGLPSCLTPTDTDVVNVLSMQPIS